MKYLDCIDNVVGLNQVGDLESIEDRLLQIEPEKLLQLSIDIRDSLPSPTIRTSPYRFVGNTEMSALPYPCASYECRDAAIQEAILFAAMYSDELVLFNPFSYADYATSGFQDFIFEMSYYLSKLIALHPLIERGIITFSDFSAYNICPECFSRGMSQIIFEDNDKISFYFSVIRKFLEDAEVIYDGKIQGRIPSPLTISQNTQATSVVGL